MKSMLELEHEIEMFRYRGIDVLLLDSLYTMSKMDSYGLTFEKLFRSMKRQVTFDKKVLFTLSVVDLQSITKIYMTDSQKVDILEFHNEYFTQKISRFLPSPENSDDVLSSD
jgi:hypothetical protein